MRVQAEDGAPDEVGRAVLDDPDGEVAAYAEPVELAQQGKGEIRAQFKFLTDWLFSHGADPAFGTHGQRDGRLCM